MWLTRLYYFLATVIILAFIDKVRIKKTFGKQLNIDHNWSKLFAIVTAIACFIFTHHWPIFFSKDFIFFFEAITIRGIFYDSALNLWQREKIDKRSATTTSIADQQEQKWFKSFWVEKLIYLLLEFVLIGIWYLL